MIYKQPISVKKTTSYLNGILIFISCFLSSFIFGQNIIAETFNSTGGPYPRNNMCPNSSKFIGVKVTNKGPGSLPKNTLITITVKITAPNTTTKTFTEKFNTPTVIALDNSDWFTFVSPTNIADLSKQGAYDFAIAATYASDTPPTAVDGFDAHQALYVAGNVLDLLSASPDRSLCKSVELDTIKYEISYNADSAYASNLPPGVSASWKSPILKIVGKPTSATNSPYNYTVRATGACPSIYDSILTGVVTVTDLPKISYTGNNPICEGFSSSASPSFGGTWKSTNVLVATISPNAGSILAVSPGKTKFYFKTNLASACSDTLPEFIVNPLPTVDPIGGPTKVCVNAKIQLTNTNKTGTWSSLDPSKATINATTGEVTGVSDGPCTIEYMVVALGCTTVVSTTITVNKLPTVNLTSGTKQACLGKTTQLTNGISNGVWLSGTPATASISAQGLVTGLAAGSSLISYTVTDANNCSKSDTTTVRIYAYPSVDPITSITKTICQNDSTQVTSITPDGVWSSAKTTIATIDVNGKVKGIAGGKSEISYVVTKNGCATSVTDTITVNPLPVVDMISGAGSVCVGTKSTLTNTTPNGVWDSSNKTVATINGSGEITTLTAGTTEISYKVTILGCITTAKKTITVFNMPSVNPITGITTVCEKASTPLSSATSGGVWSNTNNSVATISATGVVTGVKSGTSTISYAVTENGCTTTNQTTVTVTPLPIVPAITGIDSICVGDSSKFFNVKLTGTWSSADVTIAKVNATTGFVTGMKAGTTKITYTVIENGCSSSVEKTIKVNPLPVIQAISGSDKVCSGKNIQLSNSTSAGVWASRNQSIASISAVGLVSGNTKGITTISYTVTLRGCVDSVVSNVTVNQSPILSAISSSGGTNICPTKTSQMSATPIGGVWTSPASSIVSIDDKTGLALGIAKGSSIITYTVTSAEGCISDKTYTLSVDEAPTVAAILGSPTVCQGETTILTCSTPNGTWSSASPLVASIDPSTGKVTGNKAEDSTIIAYTVLLNNCSTSSYFKIKVNPMPTVNPISGDLTVCSGKNTSLSNTTPGGAWSSTYIDTATISATGIVTGIKGGKTEIKYAVTSKGCTTTQKATVTVVNSPIVPDITGSTSICVNSTSLLKNSANNGTWKSDSTKYATIDPLTGLVSGKAAGTSLIRYAVTLDGCTTEKTTMVTVKPLPNVDVISGPTNVCVGENISLTNTTKLGQWSSSDNSIASVNGAGVVTGVKGGAITINYTVTFDGCSNASSSLIAVNNLPPVEAISGITTFCSGLTSKLSCTPLGGTWSSGNTNVVTVDKNGVAFGVSQGPGSITYTVIDNGCTSKSLVNVLINQTPEVAEITGDPSVCIGSTMNLQCVTQGGNWASESTGVATIDQTGLVKSVNPGSSVISYTKIVGSCTNKKTDTITVYAMPVVAKTSGIFDICAGLSTTLKNDTTGGKWSSSNPKIAIIDGFGKLTGVSAGSAKIYYAVSKNGCTTIDSVTVNITGALQVLPITGNTTICENSTTVLKNETPNGTWSSSSDAIATINSNTGVVTGIKSGQTTITYSVVTNGVCPQLAQTTVIVNQVPIVNTISNITVCEGGKVNEIVFTGNSSPTYQWQNNNTSIGLPSSGTGNIPEFIGTGTVKGGVSKTALIQVKPNLNGCEGLPKSFSITVKSEENPAFSYPSNSYCNLDANPVPLFTPTTTIGGYFSAFPKGLTIDSLSGVVALKTSSDGYYSIKYTTSVGGKCAQDSTVFLSISNNPSVFGSLDQTACEGADFNPVNFAGSPGSMFRWTNSESSIGLTTNGLGNISKFTGTGTKTTGLNITGKIIVTPFSGSCLGTKDTFLLTVKAKDSANFNYPSNSYCNLDPNPKAILLGKKGGVFTASPAGMTLNPSTGLITLSSSTAGLYTIKYTTKDGCTNSDSLKITIGENPSVDNSVSQIQCIGSAFDPIKFTGSPGTSFDWVNDNPSIGLAASGNGNIPAFTGTGVSASKTTLTAKITVKPSIGSCPGAEKSFTLTLNYSDDVAISYSDNSYCAKDINPKPTIISGPKNGVFSATPVGLSLNELDGTINITGSKEGYYQVMYRTNGVCADTAIVPIGVSFEPIVDLVLGQTVCAGVAFTPTKFTGSPGAIFEWKNSNTAIGLAADGNKEIQSFVSTNNTKAPISSTVTVTPRAGKCIGTPRSFDLMVNPVDDATFNYAASHYCVGLEDATPIFSGTKSGKFTSSPTNGIILDPNSGKISLAASNAGSYNITYVTNGICPKVTSQLIKINPVPIVNPVTNQTVCQDNTFDAINFTGTTSTIFNWSNTDTLIGLASNGTGGIAPFKAQGTIKGGGPRSALLKVTPYIESCVGSPIEILLTVNSKDNPLFNYSDNSFCTSQTNPIPTLKGTTGGYFTATPAGIDLDPVSGTINLANSTSNTYRITYTTKGSCKADSTINIGIGSGPIVDSIINQTICAEESFSKIEFSGNPAAVYDWTNTNTTIGLSASGSGNIEKFKAVGTVPGGSDTTALIIVTPRIGTCIGKSRSFALKVKALDDASFSYSNTSFCKTENNPSPTITGLKDGKFTFSPIGLAMNAAGDINLGNSTSGSYTITYAVNKRCPNVATFPISIGSLPNVTSILDQSVCVGSSFDTIRFTGSIGAQFSWTNGNTLIGLPASGSGDINSFIGLSAVKSSITVIPFVGQCSGPAKTFNLIANPLVPTTVSYANPSYCLNPPGQAKPTPTVTGPTGGSYSVFPSGLSLDVSNGSVDLDKSLSGNYTVTYALNGVACATNATTKIAVGENPSVSDIISQTVCKGIRFNEIVFSGTQGTQFSWVNSNPSIGLSANGTGNISAFYGINGTKNKVTSVITVTPSVGKCIGTSKSFTLNINPADDASFSYTANKFCADESNPAPSITNKGGVFSASKLGIELDKDNGVIDLNKSIPGLYNITYLTKGNCPDVYTEAITLVPKPSINPILDTTVCNGSNFNTIIFKGSSNTQFDWINNNESIGLPKSGVSDITSFKAKGTIPGGSAIKSKIVVTPKIDGCLGKSISFELNVNASDAPYFYYDKYSICQNDPFPPKAILNGTKNGVFSALPSGLSINNISGEIAIATSLVNTYAVTYTTNGACPKDSTRSIIINPTPILNDLVNQEKCQDAIFDTIFFKGTANTTFKWENSNVTIGLSKDGVGNIPAFKAKGTVNGSSPVIGTITVTPEINGCFGVKKSLTLTVNQLDNPAFKYDDNSFCKIQANPTPVITGTKGGYFTFTPNGLVIDNATGTINLIATTPNNYLITYNTIGICKKDSTVSIGIGTDPSLEDIDDQDVCEGTSFDPVVFKGKPGTVFSWKNSNASVGIPTNGTTNIPAFIASGVVNFRDTIAQMVVTSRIGICFGKDTVNFKYKVRAKPNIKGRIVQAPLTSLFLKDTSICKGTNIKLIATGITKNTDYQWTPITGLLGFPTNGASVTTNLDSTQQFVVSGINQFGCSNSDSVMVRVFNPKITNILKDTTVCAGSSFRPIKFIGNTPTPSFTWTNSLTSIGLPGSGVGDIPAFIGTNNTTNSSLAATITITPKYTIPSSGLVCNGAKSIVKLSVNQSDNPSFTGYLSQYCASETASTVPFITGTKNGVFSSSPFGLVLNPNSGQLFPTASMAKSYYVKYTTKGVCPKADSMSLTIKPILTASITGDKTVCRDAIQPVITFKGANGKAPYTFKYSVNGGAAKEIKSKVATDSVTIAVPTDIAGTFVYSLLSMEESSASNCSNAVSGNVTINVNTLPIAQITGNATVCEGGSPPNITFTGVNGTSPFTFMYAVNGVTQPAISTKNGDYSVNVTQPTTTNATYTYSLIGIKDGSTLGCYQPQNNSITVSVKKLPTATIAASAKSICINGSNPTITFTGANGIQPYTFEYKINGVSNYITSNNGSSAVLDVPSNIPNKYVYELVSVKDGGQFTCTNIAIFAKDSVDVISGAFVDPIEDRTVCKDNNSGVINFTGSTNSTFSWYTNNTTTGLISSGKDSIPNFKGVNTSTNTPNISLITVTPSKGVCKGKSITFKMLVRPNPIPKTSPIKIICPGDSLLIKGITPTGISPDYQYFWTPDATLGCLDCPQVWAKPTKTTEYTFIAKDAFGCVGKDKFTMLVRDIPLIQANDTTLCGETKEITLKGTGGVTYEWSNGIVNGQPFTPNFGVNKYALTGKDKHGCVYTDTVVVSVLTQPKASFTLSTNEVFAAPTQPASILITNTSINGKKYVFNYGNGDSIVETATLEPKTAIYQYPGVATVGLIVYNGACSDAASLPIIIKKIDTTSIVKLPNVFTPNGDGENDEFMIFVKNPKTVRLTIFNRWGNPVYEITETTPSWDGIINGNLAAEGVYFYEYFIETQSGPPLKGNGYVQLIRK